MLAHARRAILFFLDFHGFKVFGFEDLTAIETLDIIHTVSSCQNLGASVLTGSLHNST
jgi:hypothetical protein